MSGNHPIGDLSRRLRHAAVILTIAGLGYAHAAPPSYMLTNLGDLVGNATIFTSHGSTAYGLNSVGQVSGSSSTVLPNGNGGPVHAFLWTPDVVNGTTGHMIDLSPSSNGIDDGDTVRINNFGQVLFTDGSTIPGVQRAPVLWTPATQNGTTGTTAALVGVTSDGFGLNDVGQVLGRMFPGLCFAWTPSQLNGIAGSINHHFDAARQQDIPGYGFGACTFAVAINDVGQVTGTVGVGFWGRPFIHLNDPIFFPNVGPLELGAIGLGDIVGPGPNADPNDQTWSGGGNAINNMGHVAGSSVFPGVGVHPFFFDGATLRDIAPLSGVPGAALGINTADQVVGETAFQTPGGGAFLYDAGTTYQLLSLVESASAQGWSQLATAYAINDSGQIVGQGSFNGQARAFLATPIVVPPPPPPIVMSYQVLFGSQSFSVPGGRTNLPWTTIAGVKVTFSKPVTGNCSSLTGMSVTGCSGFGSNTLTWTFSALTRATYNTKVLGTTANAVMDLTGNPLGGGIDFAQILNLLPGDVSDDGNVASNDAVLVNNARALPYNVIDDINGDGVVDMNDVNLVRARIGTHLP
jgi:hypothetical protein